MRDTDVQNHEKLVSLQELSGILHVSTSTLKRHIRDDAFPKLRLGKIWRFDLNKVLRYMQQKAFGVGQVERKSLREIRKVI